MAQLSVCKSTFTIQPYLLPITVLHYSEINITHLSECNSQVLKQVEESRSIVLDFVLKVLLFYNVYSEFKEFHVYRNNHNTVPFILPDTLREHFTMQERGEARI
jgi:hypothetical protein